MEEEMKLKALALGPLDGRYSEVAKKLSPYLSEYALVKNRIYIEIKWLEFFMQEITTNTIDIPSIEDILISFDMKEYTRIKEIEKKTKHDVKAVELYIGEKLKEKGLQELMSFVHFGCTSEDINNVARAIMVKEALEKVWYPLAEELIHSLKKLSHQYASIAMLAHTHGQPATPTTLGKEIAVYSYRMNESLQYIKKIKHTAKFNGATGNYAAVSIAFPDKDWPALMKKLIKEYLNLDFNPLTTQIESHDNLCHLCDAIRHFNNIILDLDLDMWTYISLGYFKQLTIKQEVGSSTMPHKVNPIKFENSEANVDMSNAIFMALSNKLSHSRMQRDLSDSSSQRNIGLAFGYSVQAIQQTIEGLKRLEVNHEKLTQELQKSWEVLAEPIQTVLRKYKIPNAYDQLKELTRGKQIEKEDIQNFIKTLDGISNEDKKVLLDLTPENYIGYSEKLAQSI